MKRILMVAILAGLFLAAGSMLSAKGDGKGCPMMKGKKDKAACCMGMDLKACKFTDKAAGKDDKPCYVCPDRDFCGMEEGKCPKCGKVLEKKYSSMMKGKKDKAGFCMGMDLKACKFADKAAGKDDKPCYVCPDRDSCSTEPGKCEKCGKVLEKKFCPMMKGDWSTGKGKDRDMYMCPMDKATSKKPGKCPKCGMAMEKVECPMKKGWGMDAEKKAPDDAKALTK